MTIEIVDLPIKTWWFSIVTVVYQRVPTFTLWQANMACWNVLMFMLEHAPQFSLQLPAQIPKGPKGNLFNKLTGDIPADPMYDRGISHVLLGKQPVLYKCNTRMIPPIQFPSFQWRRSEVVII